MSYRIPFNRPCLVGSEMSYIEEAIKERNLCGDGPFSKKCQAWFEERLVGSKVLLTTSCTSALEMAALLCDVGPGDEVIVPTYTFVSSANPFVLRGATVRFVDIRPDTLNLDETLLESALTERTKAIVPVHYAGVGCEMDAIQAFADKYGLFVIEDAAQGIEATYKDRPLGGIGDVGAFSFHETKNVICGEGGAISINRKEWLERAEIVREKGTNRSLFFRGQVDKYTWVDVGSSFLSSDILAAFLWAQLEAIEEICTQRKAIYEQYDAALRPLADKGCFTTPVVPAHCKTNHHMYYLLLPDLETRSALIQHLKQQGIQSVFHYVPLHTSAMGQNMGYRTGMFPVAESIADRLLRLPFYHDLTTDDIDEVVHHISQFFA